MIIYGHRGLRRDGAPPENTPAAITLALSEGAAGVEIDARRGPDGTLRCHHDPLPADLAGVPLLQDVIDAGRGHRVVVELKNAPHEASYEPPDRLLTLAQVLAALRPGDDVVISSFDFHIVAAAARAGIPAGHLMAAGVALRAGVAWALEHRVAEVHVPVATVLVEPGAVAAARDAGIRVVAWTVRTADEALALRVAGVDAAICDDPGSVLAVLDHG